jgi:hypothetical protein
MQISRAPLPIIKCMQFLSLLDNQIQAYALYLVDLLMRNERKSFFTTIMFEQDPKLYIYVCLQSGQKSGLEPEHVCSESRQMVADLP